MALVMECRLCGLQREVPQVPCACGGFGPWERVEVADPVVRADPVVDAAPQVVAEVASGRGEGWSCDRCGRANDLARQDCIECASVRPAAGGIVISGDAGVHVVVPGGQLPLGRRNAFSPAGAMLARFPNVGRQHALVAVDVGGAPSLTDLGSANGTWIDGRDGLERLPSGCPVPIPLGAVVQLGNSRVSPNARLTFSTGGP